LWFQEVDGGQERLTVKVSRKRQAASARKAGFPAASGRRAAVVRLKTWVPSAA